VQKRASLPHARNSPSDACPPAAYEERSPDYLPCHIYPSSWRSKEAQHQTHTNTNHPEQQTLDYSTVNYRKRNLTLPPTSISSRFTSSAVYSYTPGSQ